LIKISMDCEYYANGHDGLGSRSPLYGHPRLGFMQPIQHNGLPTENCTQRMRQSLLPNADDQQLLALNMPSHSTWPSTLMSTKSDSKLPTVAIPPLASALLINGTGIQLPPIHAAPSSRKTLTDSDRRRMCQYHEDNPSVKQTEIGGERRISNVLCSCY